jgi:phage shock protein PspC (stress-responsive transcriptional regulator)
MKKLYRSRKYRVIGGVCGGLAEYLDVDVTIVRLATVVLAFMAPDLVLLYIIAWIVMPEAPDDVTSVYSAGSRNISEIPEQPKTGTFSAQINGQASGTADEILAGSVSEQGVCAEESEGKAERHDEGANVEQSQSPQHSPNTTVSAPPMPKQETTYRNRNREFLGYFLVILGILALLKKYMPHWWRVPFSYIRMWWPVVLIALGIAFIVTALRGGK